MYIYSMSLLRQQLITCNAFIPDEAALAHIRTQTLSVEASAWVTDRGDTKPTKVHIFLSLCNSKLLTQHLMLVGH